MNPIRIFVISPEATLESFLADCLPASCFEVLACRPGPAVINLAARADIAVIDRIDERPELAQLEIALLKTMRPELSIITISKASSDRGAPVVEQGLFYYLTRQPERKLIRIIWAAADTFRWRPDYRRAHCSPCQPYFLSSQRAI